MEGKREGRMGRVKGIGRGKWVWRREGEARIFSLNFLEIDPFFFTLLFVKTR